MIRNQFIRSQKLQILVLVSLSTWLLGNINMKVSLWNLIFTTAYISILNWILTFCKNHDLFWFMFFDLIILHDWLLWVLLLLLLLLNVFLFTTSRLNRCLRVYLYNVFTFKTRVLLIIREWKVKTLWYWI